MGFPQYSFIQPTPAQPISANGTASMQGFTQNISSNTVPTLPQTTQHDVYTLGGNYSHTAPSLSAHTGTDLTQHSTNSTVTYPSVSAAPSQNAMTNTPTVVSSLPHSTLNTAQMSTLTHPMHSTSPAVHNRHSDTLITQNTSTNTNISTNLTTSINTSMNTNITHPINTNISTSMNANFGVSTAVPSA